MINEEYGTKELVRDAVGGTLMFAGFIAATIFFFSF